MRREEISQETKNDIDNKTTKNWISILDEKKLDFRKNKIFSIKLKTIYNHKPILKYILYEDENNKERYLLFF